MNDWIFDSNRIPAQNAIERAFQPEVVLDSLFSNAPESARKLLVRAMFDEDLGGRIHPLEGEDSVLDESAEDFYVTQAFSDLFMRAISDAYSHEFGGQPGNDAVGEALRNFLRIRYSDVRHVAKDLTGWGALLATGQSYMHLFNDHPHKYEVMTSPEKGETTYPTIPVTRVKDGEDLEEPLQTLDLFLNMIVPQAFPELELLPQSNSVQMLGNQQLADLLRVLKGEDAQKRLLSYTPRDFERFIKEVFTQFGYDVELTPETRDHGVDLVCFSSTGPIRYKTIVECKRYAGKVDVSLIRQFVGANAEWNADKMLYVAVSGYTPDAMAYARQPTLQGRLQLLSPEELREWLQSV